jgi:hypothetical protein
MARSELPTLANFRKLHPELPKRPWMAVVGASINSWAAAHWALPIPALRSSGAVAMLRQPGQDHVGLATRRKTSCRLIFNNQLPRNEHPIANDGA